MPEHRSRGIRSAKVADAAELLEIYGPIVRDTAISFEFDVPTEEEFARRIDRTLVSDSWLVCDEGGSLAGYAYASDFRHRPAYTTTRETTVYVHPDHHGTGVGEVLMRALLAEIRQRGAHLAVAVIALPNDASVALHEKLGFRHAGTLHDVARKFDRWQDEGLWTLRLASD